MFRPVPAQAVVLTVTAGMLGPDKLAHDRRPGRAAPSANLRQIALRTPGTTCARDRPRFATRHQRTFNPRRLDKHLSGDPNADPGSTRAAAARPPARPARPSHRGANSRPKRTWT